MWILNVNQFPYKTRYFQGILPDFRQTMSFGPDPRPHPQHFGTSSPQLHDDGHRVGHLRGRAGFWIGPRQRDCAHWSNQHSPDGLAAGPVWYSKHGHQEDDLQGIVHWLHCQRVRNRGSVLRRNSPISYANWAFPRALPPSHNHLQFLGWQ